MTEFRNSGGLHIDCNRLRLYWIPPRLCGVEDVTGTDGSNDGLVLGKNLLDSFQQQFG